MTGVQTCALPISKAAGRCDQCGGELYQRDDDAEATVGRRLDVYQTQTAPLLDYYRKRGLLVRVAGEGPVDQVAAAIQKAVKEPGYVSAFERSFSYKAPNGRAGVLAVAAASAVAATAASRAVEIGRASCRERVCELV